MRIHLRLQGAEFRVARKYARFHCACFRLLGGLDREENVVKADGKKIENHARAKKNGDCSRQPAREPLEEGHFCEDVGEKLRAQNPKATRHQRGRHMNFQEFPNGRTAGGDGAAGIPCREADESVKEAKREGHGNCLAPGHSSRGGHEISQQRREGDPCEEVER
jgi:hypothetical protein